MPPALNALFKIDTRSESPEMQAKAEDQPNPIMARSTPIKHTEDCQTVKSQTLEEDQVSPTAEIYAAAAATRIYSVIKEQQKEIAHYTHYTKIVTPAQRVYSSMELELMTIVELLRKYRVQIQALPIVLNTKSNNLDYLVAS
ncbi:RNase H-like domain found in reverse transcriptase [Phytophthora infestans]|uniref:RNase H-like domain found in reverse transcriptase n=1 Tax=Phytophthora infestans TaxID=4787 RepID=A0A8S9V877_PHYIN|nr:RNase H-like domain found in reverse transcriptase [Phytophthora infestans]